MLDAATAADAALVAVWAPTQDEVALFAGAVSLPLDTDALLAQHPSFALRRGGRCVGFGQCWAVDGATARIGRIVVDPSRRGEGLGRMLVEGLVEVARRDHPSATGVTLGVYEQNTRARALYASLGFEDTGDRTTTEVGGQVWTALQLRKAL